MFDSTSVLKKLDRRRVESKEEKEELLSLENIHWAEFSSQQFCEKRLSLKSIVSI